MLTADAWPMDEPEALSETIEMGAALARYLSRWGVRGYDEVRAIANAAGEEAGYLRATQGPPEPCEAESDDTPEHFELESPAPGLTDRQRDLLGALAAPRTVPELVEALGWSRSAVGGVAGSLVSRGLVVRIEGGLWSRR